ncbi:PLANT CADMIUM RESISTANCE 2 [Melia azedarach]|uniref:PLANT CADMIUM RESISTANCE 2 n=1 Tax=Melia azedarach TaxID=155640 RepID=A0ACC1XPV2_MELAZ|nr:PLANT CADMIUM RESISTANCE 2 [Melia azedarach]
MGNPEAGSSVYQQPQEYQYEATHDPNVAIHDEFSTPNEPQAPPPPGYQQPTPFSPFQANQATGARPAGPTRPVTYPPETIPTQPMSFPPPSPQNGPMYSNERNQASGYPSQGPQPLSTQAMHFPPQSQKKSPVYPNGPKPMPAQTAPMVYPQTIAQTPPTVGFQAPMATQFLNNGPQAQYGIPVQSPGLKPMPGNAGWSSGLFDCMNDPMNALITACFPCLTFGQLAEIVDEGHTTCGTSGILYGGIAFCIALPCLLSCTYRTKLRNKFNLPEAPAPDWVTHFLCEWCALCQEYRELQSRGYDPSIGWQGNLARNQNMQHAVMMAPANQRMMG